MKKLLYSELKSGAKKKGDFQILKQLCWKHVSDYLFQTERIASGPRLAASYRTEYVFNLEVMNHYFLKKTKDPDFTPSNYEACVVNFDSLFDMLTATYQFQFDYADSKERDRRLFFFEHQINECLEDWKYEMKDGIIRQLPEDGMKQLINEHVPLGLIEDDESKIQHAIDLFFRRNASEEDKKSALKALYELLEIVREDLKSNEYLSCEEDDIFSVANNKRIRHMLDKSDKSKTKVQESLEEPYVTWVFYKMLNTIKTYLKIKAISSKK